jgi:hypothetical protein
MQPLAGVQSGTATATRERERGLAFHDGGSPLTFLSGTNLKSTICHLRQSTRWQAVDVIFVPDKRATDSNAMKATTVSVRPPTATRFCVVLANILYWLLRFVAGWVNTRQHSRFISFRHATFSTCDGHGCCSRYFVSAGKGPNEEEANIQLIKRMSTLPCASESTPQYNTKGQTYEANKQRQQHSPLFSADQPMSRSTTETLPTQTTNQRPMRRYIKCDTSGTNRSIIPYRYPCLSKREPQRGRRMVLSRIRTSDLERASRCVWIIFSERRRGTFVNADVAVGCAQCG